MESAVISTTRKSRIFFCILAGWIPCHPNACQSDFRRKPVNKLTYGQTGVQQTDKQPKPSPFSSYFTPPWIKYWPTNRTPECPLCVTTFTNFYFYFFQFRVQFSSQQTKRVQQEHGLTLTHKHPAWPDEKLVMMAWVKPACKRKSFFLVCLMHL